MNRRVLTFALLTASLLGGFAFADHSASQRIVPATIWEIVQNPQHYKDKTVRVRARLVPNSPDHNRVWMRDAAISPAKIDSKCECLAAKFATPSELSIGTAFGTFTGKVVNDEPHFQPHPALLLLIEGVSDIHDQRIFTGPISRFQGCKPRKPVVVTK